MTTPWVFFRISDHTGTHWIEVDIASQFQKITVTIHEDSLIAPLEEMACSLLPPVDPSSISKREILHAAGQGNITDLQGQMNMVCHKAKCMDAVTEPACSFLKQEVETITVVVVQKHRLATITSKNDVVETA